MKKVGEAQHRRPADDAHHIGNRAPGLEEPANRVPPASGKSSVQKCQQLRFFPGPERPDLEIRVRVQRFRHLGGCRVSGHRPPQVVRFALKAISGRRKEGQGCLLLRHSRQEMAWIPAED